MKINTQHLNFFERVTLRQIVRANYGCTVRQAREHCSPSGACLVVQTIGATLMAAAAGLLLWPFLLLAAVMPVAVPVMAMSRRKRWMRILPTDRDNELVELA